MTNAFPRHLIVASLVASLAALPAAADSVSGFFRMADNRVEVSHGCAYLLPGATQPSKLVFLADTELDCAAAETALDPESVLEEQVRSAKGGYVRVTTNPESDMHSLYYSKTEPSDSFNTAGFGEWKDTVATAERTEASWKIEESEFFDKTYECDLSWSLPLNDGPVRGEPLPAGGGEPGQALEKYVRAVVADDYDGVRELATAEIADSALSGLGEEWFADNWSYFKEYEMAEVEVLGGTLDGDRATLQVRGKQGDGEKIEGSVRLRREGGAWKVQAKRLSIKY